MFIHSYFVEFAAGQAEIGGNRPKDLPQGDSGGSEDLGKAFQTGARTDSPHEIDIGKIQIGRKVTIRGGRERNQRIPETEGFVFDAEKCIDKIGQCDGFVRREREVSRFFFFNTCRYKNHDRLMNISGPIYYPEKR